LNSFVYLRLLILNKRRNKIFKTLGAKLPATAVLLFYRKAVFGGDIQHSHQWITRRR